MTKKNIGILLIIAGAGVGLISLLADVLGLGGDPSVIGWKQLIGLGVGLVILAVGVWYFLKEKNK